MDSIGTCIKQVGNWSKLEHEHRFDHPKFDASRVAEDIDTRAPKLKKLIEQIRKLDSEDLKKHGKLFKHFIYSDVKSAYGPKIIASALAANGFEHAYQLSKGANGFSFRIKSNLGTGNKKGNVFATLTSVSFFERPIGIRFRKELLGMFNSRPDNVHGGKIRIIILDSGFREGIDLFDVKYVHLFEPIITLADQKQAIGRATRFCGQKGLHFEKNIGWPLHVFRYETTVPRNIRHALLSQNSELAPANTFFDLFMKFTNIDQKKITFANELEPTIIFSAIDRILTKNVHNFSIEDDTQGNQYREIFTNDNLSGGAKIKSKRFVEMQKLIQQKYAKEFSWPSTKIENGCVVPLNVNKKTITEEIANQPSIITFSPTQNFVRKFFTSESDYKGLLLMHSVGTGKTCSAIAIGSSTFEKEDYTIIYVTRHTLKGDVWKNMFGQTCSVIIQDMMKNGMTIPETEAKRLRLIRAWMEPMSYKQFSNMILGKNADYAELVKRNGKKDILRKTLIIIDEAHKLNAPDVIGSEKPDVKAIKSALLHSYAYSGKDSAKLLLMTATPYTDDPLDMMKLLNLMRPADEQLPESFEDFQKAYLDEQGHFTNDGRWKFIDQITGYISYLNREKDARTFAYPVIEDIHVPMSEYEFKKDLQKYMSVCNELKHKEQLLDLLKKGSKHYRIEKKHEFEREMKEELRRRKNEFAECVSNHKAQKDERLKQKLIDKKTEITTCKNIQKDCENKVKEVSKRKIDNLQNTGKEAVKQCKEIGKQCKQNAVDTAKTTISNLREQAKADVAACGKNTNCKTSVKERLNANINDVNTRKKTRVDACASNETSCIENNKKRNEKLIQDAKKELDSNLKSCVDADVQRCTDKVNNKYNREIERIRQEPSPCDKLKESIQLYEKLQKDIIQKRVDKILRKQEKEIEFDERKLAEKKQDVKIMQDDLEKIIDTDNSQQIYLEKCLSKNKIKPAYSIMMKGKMLEYIDENEEKALGQDSMQSVVDENGKTNIYIVNGHGSELLYDFSTRTTMPDDKVLVVFPVCGRPNWLNIICKFMDIFNDLKYLKWISDPVKHKQDIEKLLGYPIRIYLPRDKVPFMSTTLFSNFNLKKTVVAKSGVYEVGKIPEINRERLPATTDRSLNLGSQSCVKYSGVIDNSGEYDAGVHREAFKGNLYKKAGQRDTYSNLSNKNYNVLDILEDVGPGIYYYTGCRTSHCQVSEGKHMKILDESAKQQQKKNRTIEIEEFKKQYLEINKKKSYQNKSKNYSSKTESLLKDKIIVNKAKSQKLLREKTTKSKDVKFPKTI
jgi:hypothetical protein